MSFAVQLSSVQYEWSFVVCVPPAFRHAESVWEEYWRLIRDIRFGHCGVGPPEVTPFIRRDNKKNESHRREKFLVPAEDNGVEMWLCKLVTCRLVLAIRPSYFSTTSFSHSLYSL